MLLDTCVVIDVLRGDEKARTFVKGLAEPPALSAVSVTELIAGVRNAQERQSVEAAMQSYTIVGIDVEIASAAGDYVREYGRSHGVDPIDALIAATARGAGLELATLNLKHFPMLKGLRRPY